MNFKKLLLTITIISIVFTLLDGVVHYFFEPLEIYNNSYFGLTPLISYMLGKFVTAFIIGGILLFILSIFTKKPLILTSILTFLLVVILEIRYFSIFEYPVIWHILNTLNHVIILFIVTLLTLIIIKDI